jgi:hypothetical protein
MHVNEGVSSGYELPSEDTAALRSHRRLNPNGFEHVQEYKQ